MIKTNQSNKVKKATKCINKSSSKIYLYFKEFMFDDLFIVKKNDPCISLCIYICFVYIYDWIQTIKSQILIKKLEDKLGKKMAKHIMFIFAKYKRKIDWRISFYVSRER